MSNKTPGARPQTSGMVKGKHANGMNIAAYPQNEPLDRNMYSNRILDMPMEIILESDSESGPHHWLCHGQVNTP